jgi:hypothetical protein
MIYRLVTNDPTDSGIATKLEKPWPFPLLKNM